MLFLLTSAAVPSRTRIGPGCTLGHGGSGVVVHSGSRIGRNVMICQQVTIGGTGPGAAVPVIGDDVYLGAGAKILGPVEIGSNCVIGANAVVTKSVPSGCVAVGIPARIIREGIDAHAIEEW
jgi:serine O-acetyltransferase